MESHRLAMARYPRQPRYRPSLSGQTATLIGWLFAAAFVVVVLGLGAIIVLLALQQGG